MNASDSLKDPLIFSDQEAIPVGGAAIYESVKTTFTLSSFPIFSNQISTKSKVYDEESYNKRLATFLNYLQRSQLYFEDNGSLSSSPNHTFSKEVINDPIESLNLKGKFGFTSGKVSLPRNGKLPFIDNPSILLKTLINIFQIASAFLFNWSGSKPLECFEEQVDDQNLKKSVDSSQKSSNSPEAALEKAIVKHNNKIKEINLKKEKFAKLRVVFRYSLIALSIFAFLGKVLSVPYLCSLSLCLTAFTLIGGIKESLLFHFDQHSKLDKAKIKIGEFLKTNESPSLDLYPF